MKKPQRPIPQLSRQRLSDFHEAYSRGDDCWNWRTKAYGMFFIDGQTYPAPRVAYFVAHKQDPGTHHVRQTCHNPACVRPDHLFLEAPQASSMPVGHPPYGERCATAKLTLQEAIKISRSGGSNGDLAAQYGVHPSTISNIRNGKRWAHEIALATKGLDDEAPIENRRPEVGC